MTIEEAIEILETLCDAYCYPSNSREKDALNLGIEALRRLQQIRAGTSLAPGDLLPYETDW